MLKNKISPRAQFIHSVQHNLLGELRTLISEGMNPNIFIDDHRNTALHHACTTGNTDMVEALMSAHTTLIQMRNEQGKNAVDLAIEKRNIAILNQFRLHKHFKQSVNYAFWSAVQHDDLESAQFILNHLEVDVVAPPALAKPLLALARQKKWAIVKLVVERYPTNALDACGYSELLIEALAQRHSNMVDVLLTAKTPLHCLYGNEKELRLNDLDEEGHTKIAVSLVRASASDLTLQHHIKAQIAILPVTLQEYFVDPLGATQFTKPMIAPQGGTYQRSEIQHWLEKNATNPNTREPLTVDELLPNHAISQLIQYYSVHSDLALKVPLLINPVTNDYYQNPVVASDGNTYEESDLEAYLKSHDQQLPRLSPQAPLVQQRRGQLYPNRLLKKLIDEVYLKRECLVSITERNIDQLKKRVAAGFSLETPLDSDQNRMAHLAVMHKDLPLFELCIASKVDFLARNKQGQSPLEFTLRSKNTEFSSRIFEQLAKNNPAELKQVYEGFIKDKKIEPARYLITHHKEILGKSITKAHLALVAEPTPEAKPGSVVQLGVFANSTTATPVVSKKSQPEPLIDLTGM